MEMATVLITFIWYWKQYMSLKCAVLSWRGGRGRI